MKVFVVGDDGPEHNSVRAVHKTYRGAFNAWNSLRISLLETAQAFLEKQADHRDLWSHAILNLSCQDPEKIDNYPHETPYIKIYELED